MGSPGSVTGWLAQLQAGEDEAAQPLWERYFRQLEELVGPEPSPEFAAQVAEEYRRLLQVLGDRELKTVAVWKMEGYTVMEIAEKLGYVTRTVERKLRLIRSIWAREVP